MELKETISNIIQSSIAAIIVIIILLTLKNEMMEKYQETIEINKKQIELQEEQNEILKQLIEKGE